MHLFATKLEYVTTTNELIAGTDLEGDDVVSLIRKSFGKNQALFNNAGQSFNHEFYWESIKPNGGGVPSGKLAALIEKDLGGFENFKKEITKAALTAFGSGLTFLIY
jgi:Fe-Mn family superoxide dismutase